MLRDMYEAFDEIEIELLEIRDPRDGLRRRPQAHVGVVLERLRDRALDLAQGALGSARGGGQRAAQCLDHEPMRLAGELEGAPLAGGADDPSGRAREAHQPVRLAAARA